MRLEPADIRDLEPVIRAVVHAVLDEVRANEGKLNGKIAYDEATAASLIGVQRHALRDARLRGEIGASKVGGKILYSRESLLQLIADRRIER